MPVGKLEWHFYHFALGRTRVGGRGGGGEATPLKVFLSFLLEDKTSAPDDSW